MDPVKETGSRSLGGIEDPIWYCEDRVQCSHSMRRFDDLIQKQVMDNCNFVIFACSSHSHTRRRKKKK